MATLRGKCANGRFARSVHPVSARIIPANGSGFGFYSKRSILSHHAIRQETSSAAYKRYFATYKDENRRGSSYAKKEEPSGFLVLSDGTCFKGKSFGAAHGVAGEVVFNTGMVGYPESLTDPSYRGQILSLTYPLVGNYGVPPHTLDELSLPKFFESERIHTAGLIVSDYSESYSHWNAARSLGDWLKSEGIPALEGIDTRAVTKKIREEGATMAKIILDEDLPFEDIYKRNLVNEVSVKEPRIYGNGPLKIIAVDCGIKYNIIRALVHKGTTVKVVPWNYDFTPELASNEWHGLFISNGPGDPAMIKETVTNIRKSMDIGKPIFGICLGNQLLALAAGAKTYKLPYGNRGQNQPVVDQLLGKAYITPQNHGFAVDNSSLPHNWKPYFINATDGSNEGIICTNKPFFSVQFHPEAKGGPYDTDWLFDKFLSKVQESQQGVASSFYVHPSRSVKKVLVLGSGGLQIGQAGEFDYSGSQAIKALKEEGVKTVLINPNIATVQTARGLADAVYFMPVTPYFVEQVIKKERPDGILLGFGGQTGLNCGVSLYHNRVLEEYGVKVLGTPVQSIIDTEDRDLFAKRLGEINVPIAPSYACDTLEQAMAAGEKIGFPLIIRAAYALGGLGSGFAENREQLEQLVIKALASSPQVLVEKSMKGWKEVEYEVVRDCKGNSITVCNMENFDPMGIHTGESIVVAPSQTLTNEEYHKLRSAALKTVGHVGIVGECNIQYSLDPNSEDYAVIEINARLSRSSALASKATGYPLAFIAAKLALGIELPTLKNSVTQDTTACFEPSLDYCVVKMPRWDIKKFTKVDPRIGSSMKSVGEVMSVGRSFEEGLQKAIRMVDTGNKGFEEKKWLKASDQVLREELQNPTPDRVFALSAAFKRGYTVDRLFDITKIDKWFLGKLQRIHDLEVALRHHKKETIPTSLIIDAKQAGFSDQQIGEFLGCSVMEARQLRKNRRVMPVVKQIDTLAAEFPAKTNYLYMTYNAAQNDLPDDQGSIIVLGSGVYRIGSSVEFDYCAVSVIRELRKRGEKTVMVNYNPETVSTDYDESDKLYFEELSLERVLDIVEREKPKGVIISVGGQQPQNIAYALHKLGVPILGTHPQKIDTAENRYKFSALLDSIGVDQPQWKELTTNDEARQFAEKVGFPVLVRPSYVLSGAAMKVVWDPKELDGFLDAAAEVSPEYPVVITKFVEGAKEIECDAVACKGRLVNWAISEHIENAGVHSGDATMILPAISLSPEVQTRIKEISEKISYALDVSGPLNIQYLFKDNEIKVIECNLRASRSFPFVSKVLGVDFLKTATQVFLGEDVPVNDNCNHTVPHYGVKAPQFSFQRLKGANPALGVEMASTGEVACFGSNPHEAFLKAMLSSTNFKFPHNKTVLLSGITQDFAQNSAKLLETEGFTLYATPDAGKLLKKYNVSFTAVPDVGDGDNDVLKFLQERKADCVFNFSSANPNCEKHYQIRRKAVDFGISTIIDPQVGRMLVESLAVVKKEENLPAIFHSEYFEHLPSRNKD